MEILREISLQQSSDSAGKRAVSCPTGSRARTGPATRARRTGDENTPGRSIESASAHSTRNINVHALIDYSGCTGPGAYPAPPSGLRPYLAHDLATVLLDQVPELLAPHHELEAVLPVLWVAGDPVEP